MVALVSSITPMRAGLLRFGGKTEIISVYHAHARGASTKYGKETEAFKASRPCARGFYDSGAKAKLFRFITPMRAGLLRVYIVNTCLSLHHSHARAAATR